MIASNGKIIMNRAGKDLDCFFKDTVPAFAWRG
jgi:hypothetical protein